MKLGLLNNGQSFLTEKSTERQAAALSLGVLFFLSGFLCVVSFLLISLGGLVRNAGAGLSCPDWPLCFGQFVPPMDVQVFLEWFHRLIAGSVSVAFLGIWFFSFRLPASLRRLWVKPLVMASFCLVAQIILGGLTVLGLLSPKWVVSHLGVGLLFFSFLFWIHLEVRLQRKLFLGETSSSSNTDGSRKIFSGAPWILALLYGQIILGGLVSSHYAGLACLDFPKCNGQWIPPLEGIVFFQWLHRLGALVVSLALGSFFLRLIFSKKSDRKALLVGSLGFVLLCFQISLGIVNVLGGLPLLVSVGHLAVAAALLGVLVYVNFCLRSEAQ